MFIRTRFAPSPTGEPHIGNIRTALFAWLFARSRGGQFLLRIEDTDKSREVPGVVEKILESLEWLNLDWDIYQKSKVNPPAGRAGSQKSKIQIKNQKLGTIYFQSQHLDVYQKYAKELVKKGCAYICTCSEERLEKLRQNQMKAGQPPMYDGRCREKNYELRITNYGKKSNQTVIRLKVPRKGQTIFNDLIRGQVGFENKLIDDQVLLKSDGYPTYHLANVVDDNLMGITHVIRAEEWLSSTPKHFLLYQFFDWKPPQFAHLPMILGQDKSKLSKRHGAEAVLEYKKQGYLPEALLNYLALLGWNPGTDQEFFSLKELIKQFSLKRVQKSPAIFNQEKLDWLNGVYIRSLTDDELVKRMWNFLEDNGQIVKLLNCSPRKSHKGDSTNFCCQNFKQGLFRRAVLMVKDRLKKFAEFIELAGFVFAKELRYNKKLLVFIKSDKETTMRSLKLSLEALIKLNEKEFKRENLKAVFHALMQKHHFSGGDILHPIRIALSGLSDSPDPFTIAEVLGKKETLRRVKQGLEKLKS